MDITFNAESFKPQLPRYTLNNISLLDGMQLGTYILKQNTLVKVHHRETVVPSVDANKSTCAERRKASMFGDVHIM